MSLIEKSNQNINAAQLLIKEKFFNTSIHAIYYSCFQMIISINKKLNININDETSHKNQINALKNFLYNNSTHINKSLFTDIFTLKKKRINADYKNYSITEKEAKNSFETAKKIKEQLNEIYEKIAI